MLEIDPEYNIDIDLLEKRVRGLNVKSEADKIEASRLLGEIDKLLRDVTSRRNGIIDEYEQRIEDTKADYKPVIDSLKTLKQTVKDNILLYNEIAKMKIAEIHAGMANGTVERSEVYYDPDTGKIVNESALTIRTDKGLSSAKTYYTLKVTDFTKVPDEYKKFDKKLAMEQIRQGKTISGIEVTEKPVIQHRLSKAV